MTKSFSNVINIDKLPGSDQEIQEIIQFHRVVDMKRTLNEKAPNYWSDLQRFMESEPELTSYLKADFVGDTEVTVQEETSFLQRAIEILLLLQSYKKDGYCEDVPLLEVAHKIFYEGLETEVNESMKATWLEETRVLVNIMKQRGIVDYSGEDNSSVRFLGSKT